MFAPRISRPRFTNFREHVSIGQTLTVPNFVALGQTIYTTKALQFFLHPSVFWRPLCQSSPIWVITYSKAPSIKLPNFVSTTRYPLPKTVDFVDGVTDTQKQTNSKRCSLRTPYGN